MGMRRQPATLPCSALPLAATPLAWRGREPAPHVPHWPMHPMRWAMPMHPGVSHAMGARLIMPPARPPSRVCCMCCVGCVCCACCVCCLCTTWLLPKALPAAARRVLLTLAVTMAVLPPDRPRLWYMHGTLGRRRCGVAPRGGAADPGARQPVPRSSGGGDGSQARTAAMRRLVPTASAAAGGGLLPAAAGPDIRAPPGMGGDAAGIGGGGVRGGSGAGARARRRCRAAAWQRALQGRTPATRSRSP